jgi:hypothetical protein
MWDMFECEDNDCNAIEAYLLSFVLEGYRLGLWDIYFCDGIDSGIEVLYSLYDSIKDKIGNIDFINDRYPNDFKDIVSFSSLKDFVYDKISYFNSCIDSIKDSKDKELDIDDGDVKLLRIRIEVWNTAYRYCEYCANDYASFDYLVSYGLGLSFSRILFYNRLHHFLAGYSLNSGRKVALYNKNQFC